MYKEFIETKSSETAKELLKSLDETKRSKWIPTVENIDVTRSSRKGWVSIHKLGGVQIEYPGE